MRILFLATTALATAALTPPAYAQEKEGFGGFHVEAVAGWDNFSNKNDVDTDSKDGFAYGGALGYDYDAGGVIIGAEVELTGTSTYANAHNFYNNGDRLHIEIGRDIYVGGRVGYAFSPQFMAYGKMGYTSTKVETRYDPTTGPVVNPNPAPTTVVEDSVDSGGFRAGVGLEYAFGGGFYVKGEYRYSHYGELRDYKIDFDRNQIMAGVGFRF